MGMIERNSKKLLTNRGRRVRIGFLTFPLWVAGALFVARKLRDKKRA